MMENKQEEDNMQNLKQYILKWVNRTDRRWSDRRRTSVRRCKRQADRRHIKHRQKIIGDLIDGRQNKDGLEWAD